MNCKLADGSLDEAVRLASLSIMMMHGFHKRPLAGPDPVIVEQLTV